MDCLTPIDVDPVFLNVRYWERRTLGGTTVTGSKAGIKLNPSNVGFRLKYTGG